MADATFTYTGAVQTYVVPAGTNRLTVRCVGGSGGKGGGGQPGGPADVTAEIDVTPGETLNLYVGGNGGSGASGGWNGGGRSYGGAGSGGGATDVRRGGTALANRVVVAGGSGGSGDNGGGAGGAAATNGFTGGGGGSGGGGGGGTQTAGGSGGLSYDPAAYGQPGDVGVGGRGSNAGSGYAYGGGGGGGRYGGGGGGTGLNSYGAGGGGGSSLVPAGGTVATAAWSASSTGRVEVTLNKAPNAPTLTTLVGGEVIDRAAANRASHSFSDPDAGDSQSAFDHRYRLVGSATWTTAYVASPNSFVDYPAGTFAAGDYERQVRTYDAQGAVGPWSPSGFFTAADAPATPTITDPIQNETIAADSRDVTWSAPAQDAYQLQVLDGGLVEHDTGTVVTTQRTAYGVPFPDNNVQRSIRVRVRYGGLWSSWYTIAVSVSYTRPPTPTVQLTVAGTAIVVQVVNPAPGAGEPAVVANDVFVTEDGQEQRRTILAPNSSWTYRLPKSGLDYSSLIRAEAIGDNGTRASS